MADAAEEVRDELAQHVAVSMPLLQGPSLEVDVGTSNYRGIWHIPKGLLCHHSAYIRAVCDKPFKEGLENKIRFNDGRSDHFQLFVQWMYFKTLPDETRTEKRVDIWFKCWYMADKLKAHDFKDAVMARLYKRHAEQFEQGSDDTTYSPEAMAWCWENTSSRPLLRQFVLDTLAQQWIRATYYRTARDRFEKALIEFPELGIALLFAVASISSEKRAEFAVKPLAAYLESSRQNNGGNKS